MKPISNEKINWALAAVAVVALLAFVMQSYRLQNQFPETINIPDGNQIDAFCRTQGFRHGWLSSSSCEVNQVQCYRDVGELKDYRCVDWKVPE